MSFLLFLLAVNKRTKDLNKLRYKRYINHGYCYYNCTLINQMIFIASERPISFIGHRLLISFY